MKGDEIEIYDEEEGERGCCDGGTCLDGVDATANNVHLKYLRIVGSLGMVLAVLEAGMGVSIYQFLSNVRLGTWWAGILAFIAGISALGSNNVGWVTATCILSSFAALLAAIAAAVEGASLNVFQNLTACTSMDSDKQVYNFGNVSDNFYSSICMINDSPEIIVNGCYCVAPNGHLCNEYTISVFARNYNNNCGNILTSYKNYLITSLAFCIAIGATMVILAILSCTVVCCPRRSFLNRQKIDSVIITKKNPAVTTKPEEPIVDYTILVLEEIIVDDAERDEEDMIVDDGVTDEEEMIVDDWERSEEDIIEYDGDGGVDLEFASIEVICDTETKFDVIH